MNRSKTILLGLLIGVGGIPAIFAQDQAADEAMKLAKKITDEGAATFSKADAKAMVAYYTEDAKVFFDAREENEIKVKVYDGHAEIENFYADLFKDPTKVHGKNTVEYARLLASDVLVIAGTFVPNANEAEPIKVPFYQVRIKKGDKWLINSLRIFFVPEKKE
jgi:ketosteroid isomerase-like protein